MNTKTITKIKKMAKRVNTADKKKKPSNQNSKIFPKALWKDANGDLFYKKNGKLVPFTGDIEKWLGVEES